MRKTALSTLVLTCLISATYGQKAEDLIKKGRNQLKIAQSDKFTQEKKDKALKGAYTLFADALELDPKIVNDSLVRNNIDSLRKLVTNNSVNQYNEAEKTNNLDSYKNSFEGLEKSLFLDRFLKNETDTSFNRSLVTYYAATIAKKGKMYEKAKEYYQLCIDNEYEKGAPYAGLSSLYKDIGDTINELDILNKGLLKYPGSKEIMFAKINYYLLRQDHKHALSLLGKAILMDPENATLYYAIGTLYDTMQETVNDYEVDFNSNKKEAINYYNKALELKADYFEALYNMGVVYYNRAAWILKEADKIPIKEQKKYIEEVERAQACFIKALPYFEKAYILQKSDKYTLQTLITIYQKLKLHKQKEVAQKVLDGEPNIEITPVSDLEKLEYNSEENN